MRAQLLYNGYNHMWTTGNKRQQQETLFPLQEEGRERGRKEGRGRGVGIVGISRRRYELPVKRLKAEFYGWQLHFLPTGLSPPPLFLFPTICVLKDEGMRLARAKEKEWIIRSEEYTKETRWEGKQRV